MCIFVYNSPSQVENNPTEQRFFLNIFARLLQHGIILSNQ